MQQAMQQAMLQLLQAILFIELQIIVAEIFTDLFLLAFIEVWDSLISIEKSGGTTACHSINLLKHY